MARYVHAIGVHAELLLCFIKISQLADGLRALARNQRTAQSKNQYRCFWKEVTMDETERRCKNNANKNDPPSQWISKMAKTAEWNHEFSFPPTSLLFSPTSVRVKIRHHGPSPHVCSPTESEIWSNPPASHSNLPHSQNWKFGSESQLLMQCRMKSLLPSSPSSRLLMCGHLTESGDQYRWMGGAVPPWVVQKCCRNKMEKW